MLHGALEVWQNYYIENRDYPSHRNLLPLSQYHKNDLLTASFSNLLPQQEVSHASQPVSNYVHFKPTSYPHCMIYNILSLQTLFHGAAS